MGYRTSAAGVRVARVTVDRFFERVSLLYEQGAAASRIGECDRRVIGATPGGLPNRYGVQ